LDVFELQLETLHACGSSQDTNICSPMLKYCHEGPRHHLRSDGFQVQVVGRNLNTITPRVVTSHSTLDSGLSNLTPFCKLLSQCEPTVKRYYMTPCPPIMACLTPNSHCRRLHKRATLKNASFHVAHIAHGPSQVVSSVSCPLNVPVTVSPSHLRHLQLMFFHYSYSYYHHRSFYASPLPRLALPFCATYISPPTLSAQPQIPFLAIQTLSRVLIFWITSFTSTSDLSS
jgi:hypothetical protein